MSLCLKIGDPVSAKFRGAMCGAVVVKVDRVLLCRVPQAAAVDGLLSLQVKFYDPELGKKEFFWKSLEANGIKLGVSPPNIISCAN